MAAVRDAHLLIFSHQLASMIRSNLQLVDVLDNLARETPQKRFRAIVEDVADRVKHGIDFGDALAEHPAAFSEIFVNIVKAGMASGRLADAVNQMSIYLSVMNDIRRKVRGAMSYPLFMLAAFVAVFNGMVFFILPRFGNMFQMFGRKLPAATQLLMDIGEFWKGNWYFVIGGIAVLVLAFASWIASPDGRPIWDRVKLGAPIIGSIWRMAALSRFLRTLAVQMRNEVRLLEALMLAAEAAANVHIREIIYGIADEIERGASLARAFRDHEIFHGIVLQMVAAGEEAGTLDDLLLSAADYFESLLRDRLETVTALINPILTILIGLMVAGMMVAAFLPVISGAGMGG